MRGEAPWAEVVEGADAPARIVSGQDLRALLAEAAGTLPAHEIRVRAWLQACDDSLCYIPQEEFRTLTVNIVAEGGMQLEDPDCAGFDASVYETSWSDGQNAVDSSTNGLMSARCSRPITMACTTRRK